MTGVWRCLHASFRLSSLRFLYLTHRLAFRRTYGEQPRSARRHNPSQSLYDTNRPTYQRWTAGSGTYRFVVCTQTAPRPLKRLPPLSEKFYRHRFAQPNFPHSRTRFLRNSFWQHQGTDQTGALESFINICRDSDVFTDSFYPTKPAVATFATHSTHTSPHFRCIPLTHWSAIL